MNPARQLKDIDRRAREAAAAYKREAVALVAKVYGQEGSQAKAATVLGISKQRVGQLLKERPQEEIRYLECIADEGVETRTVRIARYRDGAIEVYVSGTTDGALTSPQRIEFASTPPRHEDAGEVEDRLANYLADLENEGYRLEAEGYQ
ncbi:hypothetical protein [Nocardiopsis synnemataformans]|uniref:hypothetical protein n=1 Tax=Nocardiopsis synnemataformans TaxID=61305 RepID=UPI003EBDEBF7